MAVVNSFYTCIYCIIINHILYDFQDLSEVRLEVEGEEVGGQILPHFYCEDMMNVMNKVITLMMVFILLLVMAMVL